MIQSEVMKRLLFVALVIGICYLSLEGLESLTGKNLTALLIRAKGSAVTETILKHYTESVPALREVISESGSYTLNTQYVDIDRDGDDDLIVILDSVLTCGSGGCMASMFLQNKEKEFVPIDFLYTVKNIEPLDTYSSGMRDLRINDDVSNHLIWNGSSYTLESL